MAGWQRITRNFDTVFGAIKSLCFCVALMSAGVAGLAQDIKTIDPSADNSATAAAERPGEGAIYTQPSVPAGEMPQDAAQSTMDSAVTDAGDQSEVAPSWSDPAAQSAQPQEGTVGAEGASTSTYQQDDLIGAAEGVFGKGAEGLAELIQKLLKNQGEPNAYIAGREAGGAFVVGARYGSGTLFHKIEGQRDVYWTGPSVGFDAGANAAKAFVLVYNLYDSEDLYKRFPAGEGQVYVVGGLTASYLRRGDIVLIPIRAGVGLRLGVNAGYMKFSKKRRWLPF